MNGRIQVCSIPKSGVERRVKEREEEGVRDGEVEDEVEVSAG